MNVISESPDGKRRQVVRIGEKNGKRYSYTQHEVRVGAGGWQYNPHTDWSPWPAGKNFIYDKQ